MWFNVLHRRHRIKRHHLGPGSYLTDGARLFRVTSLLVNGRSMLVSIENCLTLETHAYADRELKAMRLRRVREKRVEVAAPRLDHRIRDTAPAVMR
jgi:hypothetical protein